MTAVLGGGERLGRAGRCRCPRRGHGRVGSDASKWWKLDQKAVGVYAQRDAQRNEDHEKRDKHSGEKTKRSRRSARPQRPQRTERPGGTRGAWNPRVRKSSAGRQRGGCESGHLLTRQGDVTRRGTPAESGGRASCRNECAGRAAAEAGRGTGPGRGGALSCVSPSASGLPRLCALLS